MSTAIPLIEVESNNSLRVNPDAIKILREIDPGIKVSEILVFPSNLSINLNFYLSPFKISVVCVCGIYRSGKSSLMNWLLDLDTWTTTKVTSPVKGFTVGPSVNRCTRGIWMWGNIILCVLYNKLIDSPYPPIL